MSTPSSLPAPAAERCRRILEFWHGVEFFLPFDLQGLVLDQTSPDRAVVRHWSAEALAALGPEPGTLWQVPNLKADRRIAGFSLFLGVFDRSALDAAAQAVEGRALSAAERLDEAERLPDSAGATCFAKLRIDADGRPNLAEISVSTLPWALGRLRRTGMAGLSFAAYRASIEALKARLQNFSQGRAASEDGAARPLSGEEVLALLELFYDWAGQAPPAVTGCPVVVQARLAEIRDRKAKAGPPLPGALAALADSEIETPQGAAADEDDAAGEDDENQEIEVEILNSFYGDDLEAILDRLPQIGAPLAAYLGAQRPTSRLDLNAPETQHAVAVALHPRALPSARWFDDPARNLALLQQFAVNTALGTEALFSVNGPPGTGKTTLLRDIFAELVTRRAGVLAGLARPADAFEGTVEVAFQKGASRSLSRLKPALTGFEMVVASSNNAAIDNISRDLPKMAALGAADGIWRGQAEAQPRYLREVAHKIAAQSGDAEFRRLDPEEVPWGLIACTLGRSANRKAFTRGFRWEPSTARDKPPTHFDPSLHKTIWQWRKDYAGPRFAEARRLFEQAQARVAQRQATLAEHADRRLGDQFVFLDRACAEARAALAASQAETGRLRARLAERQSHLVACEHDVAQLREIRALLAEPKPSLWRRLTGAAAARAASAQAEANRQALAAALQARRDLGVALDEAQAACREAEALKCRREQALAEAEAAIRAETNSEAAGRLRFPRAGFPPAVEDLLDEDWQLHGIWQDEELAFARSQLFAAALALHEAWLADVLRPQGGLWDNLVAACDLLQGSKPLRREHEGLIWQSFFLVVPVVSTTFASVHRQFSGLGCGDLGWLFIDEAGQAPPQAAVGALWRAKRAVVVGDPLQIEPVFTVPTRLVRALAAAHGLPPESDVKSDVMPQRASVQSLADAANPIGAWLHGAEAGRPIWVGSPLRVHRRCADPMFSLANRIAYEDRMVFGRPSRTPDTGSLDLGASAWVEIEGKAADRQLVVEEVALVEAALHALVRRLGDLPPLYVISPFKRIKQDLIERLGDPRHWPADIAPSARALTAWCRDHVGTVHTFQGKEQDIVWMVLGCDEGRAGAVDWASAKPNLLNVALTRAKARVFLIGKPALWGSRPYFSLARASLPCIDADLFLERCRGAEDSPDLFVTAGARAGWTAGP